MATEQDKAALSKSRGAVAAGISDPEKKRKFIADSGEIDKDFEGSTKGLLNEASRQYREGNEKAAADVLPKMHKGGVVKKDGPHNLQKGETVLPKDEKKAVKVLKSKASGVMAAAMDEEDEPKGEEKKESKKEEKSEGKHKTSDKHNPAHEEKGKKKAKGIHFRHGSSGGFIAKHDVQTSEDGKMGEPEEHVLPNIAALHAHIDEHMGDGEPVAGGEEGGAPEGGAPAQA